jgi:hypothetical protein
MQCIWLLLALFVGILILHGFFVTEAFGSQPGTQIQMNANRPVYFVTTAPVYSR